MSLEHSPTRAHRFGRIPVATAESGLSRSALYGLATQHKGLFKKAGSATIVDLNMLVDIIAELPDADINISASKLQHRSVDYLQDKIADVARPNATTAGTGHEAPTVARGRPGHSEAPAGRPIDADDRATRCRILRRAGRRPCSTGRRGEDHPAQDVVPADVGLFSDTPQSWRYRHA